MPNDLEADVAEMLEDDFPTPLVEEGVESGRESVTEPEEKVVEPATETVKVAVEEEKVSPEPIVEGTPEKGGEPAEEGKETGPEEGPEEGKMEEVVEEVSELEALKSQVGTLMNLLNTAHSGGTAPTGLVASGEPEAPMDFKTFMESVDFDSVMESKDAFMSFFVKSMDIVRQQTEQSVMAAVPQTVEGQIQRANTMRDVANEFYTTYPELSQIKGYVANVAAEVSAKNPEWDMGKVLEETAKATKSTLGLSTIPKTPSAPTAKAAPVLPGGTRTTKTPSSKKSVVQSEIDDFLSDL